MRVAVLIFLTLLFSGILSHTYGQLEDPVKWVFSVNLLENNEAEIVATASIEDKWHICALNATSDPSVIGPMPTILTLNKSNDFSLLGKTQEGKFITSYDQSFGVDLNYFEKKATFRQKIKILSENSFKVSGSIEWMACDDSKCTFPSPLEFEVEVKKQAEGNAPSEIAESPEMNDGSSGIFDPVQWSIKTEKNSSGEYSVIFISTIEKGWHIYSQHLERNDGPIPTVFQFRPNEKIELNGTVKEGNPLKSYDPNFMMTLNYYEGVANFTQKLRVKEEPVTLEASVTFMVCHEEHGCLPDKTLHYRIHLPSGLVSPFDPETESNTLEVKSGFRYFLPTVNTDAPLVTDCGLVSGEPEKNSSLWQLFVLGFLGGLFALLTPCVFPMIPLTVSFFTKGSQTRKQGLTRASVYGLFIFLIYVLLSLPFFVFDQIDENILNNISTNVPLNVFFFVIFVVFAISFFGYFEITLPASLANKMDSASNTGGMIGSFFMALTLAIVSFSCTGPILGSLLAGSLSKGGAIQLTAGMGGFGLALGIPFALFAAFPGMLKSLPKSGGWLNSVKVVLGFIELALALKFLSQADLVDHWGVLKYELFMGLWIAIFALTALYIFGIIRFPHDSKIKKFSPFRIGFGIIVTTLTLYLASGFRYDEKHNTYKSLSLLSGLAPPVGYSWVYPKDCPHNLDCEHDYDLALERSKRENKPLFVDFTGYACVNCRKMEEHIWIEPDVLEILSRDFIVVSLYVDDKKELPEELQEKYTSMRTGATKNIRTYGDKWAAFQIETFNRNSQPLYCILTPDEKLVNKPAGFTSDKDEYKQWLVCGRDAAKQEMTQTASSR